MAALLLIVGMTVQFVLSYRQAMRHVQENIDLKTQIAHEKILFELYDAYEVVDVSVSQSDHTNCKSLMTFRWESFVMISRKTRT